MQSAESQWSDHERKTTLPGLRKFDIGNHGGTQRRNVHALQGWLSEAYRRRQAPGRRAQALHRQPESAVLDGAGQPRLQHTRRFLRAGIGRTALLRRQRITGRDLQRRLRPVLRQLLGDHFDIACAGLLELGATQTLALLEEARRLLFGTQPVPTDQGLRQLSMPTYADEQDLDCEAALDALDNQFYKDAEQLDDRLLKYALEHGLFEKEAD